MSEEKDLGRELKEELEKQLDRISELEDMVPPEVYDKYAENIELAEAHLSALECSIDESFKGIDIDMEAITDAELVEYAENPVVKLVANFTFFESLEEESDSESEEDQEELAYINLTFTATYKDLGKAPKEFWELYTLYGASADIWVPMREYLHSFLETMKIDDFEFPENFEELIPDELNELFDEMMDDFEEE